jgi:hypothetical protein
MRSKESGIRFGLAILLAAGVFVPGFAASAQERTFTRFLLPFYVTNINPTPGAYGSRWGVETWLHYGGSEDAFMVPRPLCPGITCMDGWLLEPGRAPLPFRADQFLPLEPAIFIHVDSRYAPFVKFSSRIRDLSRMTESAGTSVPVVREDQFSATPLVLLNVSVDPAFRNMLRIYALPEVASPAVEVRYFRHPEADAPNLNVVLLRSERVSLRTTPGVIGEDFPLYPSMAERGNLQDLAEFAGHNAVWIEIVPVTPGLRFWAFVSVTNNTTQEVTIIAP